MFTFHKKKLEFWSIACVGILLLYVFLYFALQQGWLSHNPWDSFAVQAKAWWHGNAHLDKDYPHLELAIYKQQYFVSFPPVPTLPHFLLYPFFGDNTPNTLLNTLYAVVGFILAVRLVRVAYCWKRFFIPVAAIFGSNILFMSVSGGVWFQAQLLAFDLTMLAFLLVVSPSAPRWVKHAGFLSLALAVGCRPFMLVYFPVLLWIVAKENSADQTISTKIRLLNTLPFLLLPVLIGALLAWYNWIRFDNPFEFGHNYLPEFVRSKLGQFSWRYIPRNLADSFRLPHLTEKGGLAFERFDGSLFFLVNPIFCIFFLKLRFWKKSLTPLNLLLIGMILIQIMLTLSHKTMGGWHFGNRYFTDMIPALLLFIRCNEAKSDLSDVHIGLFAVALNAYGTLWMLLNW